MGTHTPGPWLVEPGAKDVKTFPRARIVSKDDGLGPIAFATEANAKLIAASPQLLTALLTVLPLAEKWAATEHGGHPVWTDIKTAWEAVYAAQGLR